MLLENGGTQTMAWNKTITINANIETVWTLFNEENYKKIMPQVVSHELVSEDIEAKTKVYEEVYREGRREETYLLTEIIIENSEVVKHKTFNFTISNMIYSEGSFLLEKIDKDNTKFTYSGFNEGMNVFIKIMLKFVSKKNDDKVVDEFLERLIEHSE